MVGYEVQARGSGRGKPIPRADHFAAGTGRRTVRGLALLLVLVAAAAARGQNLVPNPGFEALKGESPVGWAYDREVVSLATGVAHEGMSCLKVRTDKPINVRYGRPYTVIALQQAVPVTGDRVYWLSVWTRCLRFGGGYPCLAYVRWLTSEGKPAIIERSELSVPSHPHGWQWTRCPVVSPKDAVSARLHLVVWADYSDVFVDEVSLSLAGQPQRRQTGAVPGRKLRIMDFPEWPESAEEIAKVRDHGFNLASLLYYRCYDPKETANLEANLELAKAAKLRAFVAVWLSEVAPPAFRDTHPLITSGGTAHKRTPSIFHREWWDEWFAPMCLRFVRQSRGGSISGLWVDFELYDEPNQVESVCYCPRCLGEYETARGLKVEGKETTDRVRWLLDSDRMQDYQDFHASKLGSYAASLRAATDRINPKFLYGTFPYYGNLADRVFAEKLGTRSAPFLIGPEYTYRLESKAYSDATAVQLATNYCEEKQRQLRQSGLHAWLVAGICPESDAAFMRDKIVAVCGQTEGYWLWTKRIIDSRRFHFDRQSPMTDAEAEAAWRALKEANEKVMEDARPR